MNLIEKQRAKLKDRILKEMVYDDKMMFAKEIFKELPSNLQTSEVFDRIIIRLKEAEK